MRGIVLCMPVSICALCQSGDLVLALDLGFHPLADTFLKKEQLMDPEVRYPLQMLLCKNCGHAMSSYIVPPQKRYQENDYSYDSGNSKVSVEHFGEMAADISKRVGLQSGDLVVDIGSSVGTLLEAFRTNAGAAVLGVEPAYNIAEVALQNNVPTVNDFWGERAAAEVVQAGKAKVITSTNAFNHIGDLDSFMQTTLGALRDDGTFVFEVPYLLHLVELLAFDTIYLEHTSYFALRPLQQYFKKFGLVIVDVQENTYMGGTVRVSVTRGGTESPAVAACLAKEEAAKLFDEETYTVMMRKVQQFKFGLLQELLDAKKGGGVVIGIGAATKGNTLLNYCGIDTTLLDFITDASPRKVGKYTPGSHIPILPDEAITDAVTHALILPWNIGDFLKGKLGPKYPKLAFITPHMEQ